jgi:hypothetical protein
MNLYDPLYLLEKTTGVLDQEDGGRFAAADGGRIQSHDRPADKSGIYLVTNKHFLFATCVSDKKRKLNCNVKQCSIISKWEMIAVHIYGSSSSIQR